jgi:hypothetical protein
MLCIQIIPNHYKWSTSNGTQSHWSWTSNSGGVPFGAAFDCTNGKHLAQSVIDFTHTTANWFVDRSISQWYTVGNNMGNVFSYKGRTVITSTGGCGATSVMDHSEGAWTGAGLIAIEVDDLCDAVGLTKYPIRGPKRPSINDDNGSRLCWLSLGNSLTSSTVINNDEVQTSNYHGIGVLVTPSKGFYALEVLFQYRSSLQWHVCDHV